jgi:hypothetical protein
MIVPVVVVALQGTSPDIERDLAMANTIWGSEVGVWFEIDHVLEPDRPDLLFLSQEDCKRFGHVVSAEEDELFDIGRGLDAELVGYYIDASSFGDNVLGCAAHPPGRRGFWVIHDTTFDFVWAHEATHVIGQNPHVTDDTDNLMYPFVDVVTNLPADLNDDQRATILNDPALLSIESIVLNL